MAIPANKPFLELVGKDGNAFSILGRAHRVAKATGWTEEEWDEFKAKATGGNYENLLNVCQEFFNVS